jgi:hypothetical protein
MRNHKSVSVASADRFLRVTTCGGRLLGPLLAIFLFITISIGIANQTYSQNFLATKLRTARTSPLDLELGGDPANLPPHTTRYLTREDLLLLPQINFTVTNDANFAAPTQITGISLEELTRQLAANPNSALTIAICNDKYRAHYPLDYIAAHHPVLVLKINGQPPSGWPKDAEAQNLDMGPYMITHPSFTSSFKILSYSDEPQIPWGVLRIEFGDGTATRKFRAATASRNKSVSTAITWATQADKKRASRGLCFRRWPSHHPILLRPTFTTRKIKILAPPCPHFPNTMLLLFAPWSPTSRLFPLERNRDPARR